MTGTAISALPSATTPLAGTEVLPIVQGGVTDKVTVADLLNQPTQAVSVNRVATSGAISATAWTTNGTRVTAAAATLTATTGSGTVAAAYTDFMGAGTIVASNATVFTHYYNLFIGNPVASTNVTMTNKWSLGLEGGLRVLGVISSPGAGTESEHFGISSSAAGNSSAVFGAFATSPSANGAVFGYDAHTTGAQGCAFGRAASAGNSALAAGYASTSSGINSIGLGNSASALASGATVVGQGGSVAVAETDGVVLGRGASITTGSTGGGENIAAGALSIAAEWRATALGWKAKATGISSTALGRGAYSAFTHAIAIGRGAWTNAINQIAIGYSGGNTQTDVYFESGHTSKYVDYPDGATITRTPSLIPIVIHGFDGFDATVSPTNNIAGGDIIFAAGRGTGTAAGGSARIQVAPAGGVSNNTKNALVDGFVVSTDLWSKAAGNLSAMPAASVTPTTNGEITFELTNNTTLTLKAKGSDGVVRSVALTLA